MAGQGRGDDFFSDDDIDALPDTAFQELENRAIQFTQHQTQATVIKLPPSSDYGDEFDDEDLDDAVVFDEAQNVPNRLQSLPPPLAGLATQREQFRQRRYAAPTDTHSLTDRPSKQDTSSTRILVPVNKSNEFEKHALPEKAEKAVADSDVHALQKQIQELMREREFLKQDLSAKAGEIAIVRSKQEKASKEYEREMTAIRKLNAERIAQHQKSIDAARDAEKTTATELEFVKRDLFEEAEKVRNLRRAKEKEKGIVREPISTPKKEKTSTFRDGFDDDEIQNISPSKFQARRSNAGTPTKGGIKRKRKGPESPVVPLEVIQGEQIPLPQAQSAFVILDEYLLDRLSKPDDRLDFLEMILDHRSDCHHLRTIEEFTRITFPSSSGESFASIILGKLPTLSMKLPTSEFPVDFCELIISLWSRCLTEKFYTPLFLLIDLLTFALELRTLAVAPYIIDSLLPVAQMTGDLIAIPRFKRESYSHLVKYIDVSACLAVMHLAALGCMSDNGHTTRFWLIMRLEFVLMILSQHQQPKDFELMLSLLSMSSMKDSIGPKVMDQDTQREQVVYIIDRISLLLVTSPSISEGYDMDDLSVVPNLRLQILRTFDVFCQYSWGAEALAMHSHAIGRLVKLMNDELDAMYDYASGHDQSSQIVCLATRLVHYLVTRHDKVVNMQQKLSVIYGGDQKYLLCLARLNFSEEDLVLDADIGPEIAECAHELLELAVTPEEGDAVYSAFSST